MIVKTFRHSIEPALYWRRVENHLLIIRKPDGREHIAKRIFEFTGLRCGKFWRVHHGAQDTGDVTIASLERVRHAFDERVRRIVRDKIHRDTACNVMRRRRMVGQDVHGLVDLRKAATFDRMPQKAFVAVIVASRVEFEKPITNKLICQLGT